MAAASAFGVGESASGLDMMGRPVGLPTAGCMSSARALLGVILG